MLTLKGLRSYNRYQAALGHAFFSLIIFAILGYLVYFCWYPQPLFAIDAGWQGLRILAFVDFVLGPLITLFIFNPQKKELFKDLAIVALIQISALSYGVYHVYQSRPAIVVYADNQYRTIALSQLEFQNLPESIGSDIPLLSPKYYVLDIPRDNIINIKTAKITIENMDDVLNQYDQQRLPIFEANQQKRAYYLLPERLKPYNQNLSLIKEYRINENEIRIIEEEESEEITKEKHYDENTRLESAMLFLQNNQNAYSVTSVKGRFGYALVSIDQQGRFTNHIEGHFASGWLSK